MEHEPDTSQTQAPEPEPAPDVDEQIVREEIERERVLERKSAPKLQSPLRANHHDLLGLPLPGPLSEQASPARRRAQRARLRVARGRLRKAVRVFLQLSLIVTICLAGEKVAEMLPFDMPSNICSMLVLLVFLASGVLKMDSISDGADFLLDHMSIFFIPAAVAIMGSFDLLAGNIAKLVAICLITTVLVFFVTSFTVSTTMNLMARREARRAQTSATDAKEA